MGTFVPLTLEMLGGYNNVVVETDYHPTEIEHDPIGFQVVAETGRMIDRGVITPQTESDPH